MDRFVAFPGRETDDAHCTLMHFKSNNLCVYFPLPYIPYCKWCIECWMILCTVQHIAVASNLISQALSKITWLVFWSEQCQHLSLGLGDKRITRKAILAVMPKNKIPPKQPEYTRCFHFFVFVGTESGEYDDKYKHCSIHIFSL